MSSSAHISLLPALKNILFATDFSTSSEAAVPVVRSLAARFGSTVHFVHVIAPEARGAAPMEMAPDSDVQRNDAEDEMQFMLAGDRWRGIPHTSTVERGEISTVLASFVGERKIDLIVLGTHGRRGLNKVLLGSTAEQVIRMSPCPVLTIGPNAQHPEALASNSPVLFATDFSSGAHYALGYAALWARANRSRLVLVHAMPSVMDVPPGDPDPMPVKPEMFAALIEGAYRQSAELIEAEELEQMEPETIVENGPAVAFILSAAREKRAGLIVMGAHRPWSTLLAGHLPWATVSAILCEAPCPVITVLD